MSLLKLRSSLLNRHNVFAETSYVLLLKTSYVFVETSYVFAETSYVCAKTSCVFVAQASYVLNLSERRMSLLK